MPSSTLKRYVPAGIAPPFSKYSHAVDIPQNARVLHASGQVGVRPDGSFDIGDFDSQARQTLANLKAILNDADMGWDDVVKIDCFLTRQTDTPAWRAIREEVLGEARPASTLLVVAGLANPDWLIEVEVIAAKV